MAEPTVFDEDTGAYVHGAAIPDVPTDVSADVAANADAINGILAALRSRGIIAQD
ncbi:hypothetical protein AB0I72_20000 [Nocardiopsis sp. NPDC049922]|uniref:hypothetical protein n=1 Tax=Nocardiopsis sp. NPDC049922 TaxID=3155157 RepID=UPI00340694A1